MKIPLIKRYKLTNALDGWPCDVLRDGAMVRTWSLADGRRLELSIDGHSLALRGTKTLFVLPADED